MGNFSLVKLKKKLSYLINFVGNVFVHIFLICFENCSNQQKQKMLKKKYKPLQIKPVKFLFFVGQQKIFISVCFFLISVYVVCKAKVFLLGDHGFGLSPELGLRENFNAAKSDNATTY